MVARARLRDESFEKYRKNLKVEDTALKQRLSGRMVFSAIKFIKRWIKELGKTQVSKQTRTYKNPRRVSKGANNRVARRARSLVYRRGNSRG